MWRVGGPSCPASRARRQGDDMSRRRRIDGLPEDVRRQIDERLVAGGFGGYEALAAWLGEMGLTISKSALHRYGKDLQSQYDEAMSDARALLALTRAAGDLGESGSEIAAGAATILQTDIVRTALEIRREKDPEKRASLLAKLTRAQADIGRMTISVEKFRTEIRAKAAAAADTVTAMAKKGGLTPAAIAAIRRNILGIA